MHLAMLAHAATAKEDDEDSDDEEEGSEEEEEEEEEGTPQQKDAVVVDAAVSDMDYLRARMSKKAFAEDEEPEDIAAALAEEAPDEAEVAESGMAPCSMHGKVITAACRASVPEKLQRLPSWSCLPYCQTAAALSTSGMCGWATQARRAQMGTRRWMRSGGRVTAGPQPGARPLTKVQAHSTPCPACTLAEASCPSWPCI